MSHVRVEALRLAHPEGVEVSELVRLALNIARNCHWPVFPCGDDKAPCISKREGGNGFHDASVDPTEIVRLFSHHRAALVGIPTGEISGFDVLDIDVKHDEARAWLLATQEKLPATRTFRTRSGGFHLFFRHSAGVHNTESQIAKGIDTRGEGGYIIFWFAAGFPCTDHSTVAKWPDWLLETLFYKPAPQPLPVRGRAFRSNSTSAENLIAASISKVESATEGHRHATLRAAACAIGGVLGAAGISHHVAERLLLDAILVAGGARVDQQNALSTINSGLKWGAASPLVLSGAA
jgi:hypothetical protein